MKNSSIRTQTELTDAILWATYLVKTIKLADYRFLLGQAVINETLDVPLIQFVCGHNPHLTLAEAFAYLKRGRYPEGFSKHVPPGEFRAGHMPLINPLTNPQTPEVYDPRLRYRVFTEEELQKPWQLWAPYSDVNNVRKAFFHYVAIGSIPFFIFHAPVSGYAPLLLKMLYREPLSLDELDFLFTCWNYYARGSVESFNDTMRQVHPWNNDGEGQHFFPGTSFKDLLTLHGISDSRMHQQRVYRINWQLGESSL